LTVPVSVQDVADALDGLNNDHRAYLKKSTCEIIMLSLDELSDAEEYVHVSGSPAWQQEAVAEARKVLAGDEYILLPDAAEVNAYRIMQDFCSALEDRELSEELEQVMIGRGAFRRFKDTIRRRGVEDDWHRFRGDSLRNMAITWLKASGMPYSPD
jgi:hypothetical protein